MGWESSDVFRFDLGPLSRSNDGSLALVSCLFGGYKFASVLQCVGLVKRPVRDACLHMGGILAEGSAGSASLPTNSVFTSGWNFFKLGTYI